MKNRSPFFFLQIFCHAVFIALLLLTPLAALHADAPPKKPNDLPKTTAGTRHQIALEPLLYQVPMLFRGSRLTLQPRICMTKV